jgi:hypothetical protein
MTTPNADTTNGNPPGDGQQELALPAGNEPAETQPTESLLTGQDGDEAVDDAEVEEAMLAGFSRVNGQKDRATKPGDDEDAARGAGEEKPAAAQADTAQPGEGGQPTPGASQPNAQPTEGDDPEVPGLGMKASEVKAQFAQIAAMNKARASANGHIGNLKQQLASAGKAKTITKEMLPKVREEFGDEYAEALAADLTAAGAGVGGGVDDARLEEIVGERLAAQRDELSQQFERRLVAQRHPDSAHYFAGGKHNAEFVAFIKTLPAERQQELNGTWDSVVINAALDEFKDARKKAASQQGQQQRRIERGVMPTASRGGASAPPVVDPIEAGWNNVRGRGRGNARVGARS